MKNLISTGSLFLLDFGFLLLLAIGKANAEQPQSLPDLNGNPHPGSAINKDGLENPIKSGQVITKVKGGLICGGCDDPENMTDCKNLAEQIQNGTVSQSFFVNTSQAFCYSCIKGVVVTNNIPSPFFGCLTKYGIVLGKNGRILQGIPSWAKLLKSRFDYFYKYHSIMKCDFDHCNLNNASVEIKQQNCSNDILPLQEGSKLEIENADKKNNTKALKTGGLICGSCNDPVNTDECQNLKNQIINGTLSNPRLVNTSQIFCYRCVRGFVAEGRGSSFRFFGCMDESGVIFGWDGQPIPKIPNLKNKTQKFQIDLIDDTLITVWLCDFNLCNLEKNTAKKGQSNMFNYNYLLIGLIFVLLLISFGWRGKKSG